MQERGKDDFISKSVDDDPICFIDCDGCLWCLGSVAPMTSSLPKESPMEVISKGLAEYFKDDPGKIAVWLLTKNPNFGMMSPAELTVRHPRGLYKVATFIKNARNGDVA